jgi:uncharacterized protein YndB with AHSA1/START domain
MCVTSEMLNATYGKKKNNMEKLNFTSKIQAPADKVWHVLWNDDTYRKWTGAFAEGSYAVSDWKEGSRVKFLTDKGHGMYSLIEKSVPGQYISFKHLGEIKNGVEQPLDLSKHWSGAMENYTLNERNGETELTVDIDILESDAAYFKEKFPEALAKVKKLAEE